MNFFHVFLEQVPYLKFSPSSWITIAVRRFFTAVSKIFTFTINRVSAIASERSFSNTAFWKKVIRPVLLSMVLLELFQTFSKNGDSWNASLVSNIVILVATAAICIKSSQKSAGNKILNSSNYSSWLILPILFTCASTVQLFNALESDAGTDASISLFFLKIFLVTILAFEPSPPKESSETQTGSLSTLSKYYRLKEYLIPTSKRGIFFLVLFFTVAILESIISFCRHIYSMHIVSSIQFSADANSTLDSSVLSRLSTLRLEFRWDYVVIYHIFKFMDYSLAWMVKQYVQKLTELESSTKLQMAIFTKLQALSLRWHLENQTSETFAVLTTSPYIVRQILYNVSMLTSEFLSLIATIAYLVNSYPKKISTVVILCAVLSCVIDIFVIRRRKDALKEMREQESKVRKSRSGTFENYETMKYFTNEEYEQEKYKNAYHDQQKQQIDDTLFRLSFRGARDFLRVGAELIVMFIVLEAILDGDKGLGAGDYLYCGTVFRSIFWPVDAFFGFLRVLQERVIDAEKICAVLDLTPEITDAPNSKNLEVSATGGSIEFRNVCFSYVPERQVIKNTSFIIPAGKTVAFVGRSGSGKSTLTKLLFRFYDITSGQILVDGQDIRQIKIQSLRQAISVVPQDVVLFSDTIKHNIQYGKLDATDDEIQSVAKAAFIHDRINTLPDKYETEVGNRGLKMSGGEKQRIGIARAILRNPPILVLDEATSSLDTETEKQIQSSLETLTKNRTTIIIAHRLSTIASVDTIVVLDEGQVVECGSHCELLEKNGVYTTMWNQQFQNGVTSAATDHNLVESE